jgi:hypothetical protein
LRGTQLIRKELDMIPLDRFFEIPDKRRTGFADFDDDEYISVEEEDDEVYEYDDFASDIHDEKDE